jgi:hypothetical protein
MNAGFSTNPILKLEFSKLISLFPVSGGNISREKVSTLKNSRITAGSHLSGRRLNSRAIACSAITRFSLEEDQIPAAANSRASAFKQCRSFHLIPLKAYASGSYLLHAIALG